MSNDQISNELEKMDRDSKALRDEALRICWYMRGGISFEDAMLLNNQDRELIAKIIKENLETTQKSGMPFF